MKKHIYVSTLCVFLIVGCSSSDDDNRIIRDDDSDATVLAGLESCEKSDISQTLLCGTAFATDGVTPLIGAEISLAESTKFTNASTNLTLRGIANDSMCLTDSRGEYACVLPASIDGTTTFLLSADGFNSSTFEVNIQPTQIANAPILSLEADSTVQWAVVPGVFDGVQVLLSQLKGCTLNDSIGNPWNAENSNPADARGSTDCESKGLRVLETDELDFYTDGSLDQFDALFINCNTDLSQDTEINDAIRQFNQNGNHVYFSDLSDFWLETIFPDQITFAGNSTGTASSLPATVVDENLAAVVGSDISLVFDFPAWTAIDSVSADSTVYIEADISELSTYDGIKPITVGFKPEGSNACVFFTSYHIEGASSGSDQELAIKYLVQNIGTVCT